jgi:hypothetical protein
MGKKISNVEGYIIVSKLIDRGENKLAEKLMTMLTIESHTRSRNGRSYHKDTILPNDRAANSAMNNIAKILKKQP